MTITTICGAAAIAIAAATGPLAASRAQQPAGCPMHAAHASQAAHDHHAGVDARGDAVMGFGHGASTHHFRLLRDGGVIRVTANDPADAATATAVREHMRLVARAFAGGDFAMPEAIHGRVPPGAAAMRDRRDAIAYRVEDVAGGALVRITTSDPAALAGVHEFLAFQIDDHRTGDPVEVSER